MHYTLDEIVSSKGLPKQSAVDILTALGHYSDQKQYTETEVADLDAINSFLNGGQAKNIQEALELLTLQKNSTTEDNKTTKNGRKSRKNPTPLVKDAEAVFSVNELLNFAKDSLGLSLTLGQASKIIEAAGLEDKDSYNRIESEKFLIVCQQQSDNPSLDIGSVLIDSTTEVEAEMLEVIDFATNERAKEIPGAVKQFYIKNVVAQLRNERGSIKSFFDGFKEHIVAGVEGKSPLPSIMQVRWMPRALNTLPPSPNQLPPTSENGVTPESNS